MARRSCPKEYCSVPGLIELSDRLDLVFLALRRMGCSPLQVPKGYGNHLNNYEIRFCTREGQALFGISDWTGRKRKLEEVHGYLRCEMSKRTALETTISAAVKSSRFMVSELVESSSASSSCNDRHAFCASRSAFQVPSQHTWNGEGNIVDYLAWFQSPFSDDVRLAWECNAWVFGHADASRSLKLHCRREADFDTEELGSILCTRLKYKGDYDVKEVTGLDYAVVRSVINQCEFPSLLNRIITQVEKFDLSEVNLICVGATHRSVATAFVLMMVVYHKALFVPHSHRVERDATYYLQKVP